jgi:chemotaxis family two-component system sensor kinase Cph1
MPDLEIVQVSANTLAHVGLAPEALLGRHLGDLFAPADAAQLSAGTFKAGKRRYRSGISSLLGPKRFDAMAHKQENLLIIELEPQPNSAEMGAGFEVYSALTDALTEFDGFSGLSDLCQRIATRIRHVTGFDRVMVYRLLEDDSGSVIAEDRRADLTPFLGLRYPASDIPAQARRLYLLNTLRLKPDVNAPRSPIIPPLNPRTGLALDMSFCILRAMSPVHDEYLRNMGVSSSLSISILVEERLWGLIACHHGQPKLVPQPVRVTCEVLARVFSSSIAAAEEEDKRFRVSAVLNLIQSISDRLRSSQDLAGTLHEQGEHIKSAMRSDGVAFYIRGKLTLAGTTAPADQVNLLLNWLTTHQQVHILATQRLASDYPEAGTLTRESSGILSKRIALGGPDFVIWFRSGIVKTINWGGNPEKPVEAAASGERISPRRSFDLWKQTVGDSTEPWDETDRQFARSLRHVVSEALLLQLNEEARRLNIELSRSNIELDSFAYAASHDLQEPLRTIRAYTQLILRNATQDFAPRTREFLSIIESNASRMGNLLTSLLSYSELGGKDKAERKPVNTEGVLSWALTNLHEQVEESGATVTHDALPVIQADPDHMLQLLQNLISNAIKYRRSNNALRIHLSAALQGNEWHFSIRDNGQGFAPQYAELIFQAFKRLHGREVAGSGIGLATCKRIVELHGGRIWAESGGQNCGATFHFTAPYSPFDEESI